MALVLTMAMVVSANIVHQQFIESVRTRFANQARLAQFHAERDDWLEADRRVWTPFLQGCDGFVRKEVWFADDSPEVVVVVWWESMAHWKAIDPDTVAAVDARMGDWHREPTCRSFRVTDHT